MILGDLRVVPLVDGSVTLSAAAAYPRADDDAWAAHRRWLAPDGSVELILGGFLVLSADRVVLVDAGLGPLERGTMNGGALPAELRRAGFAEADVTDVVFTHLHFDHVGWATQDGEPYFPNATYRCDGADWEHFMHEEGARKKLAPIEARLETWRGSVSLAPGIDTMPTPGHTPGHAALVLSSGPERAYLLGDVAHCPVELEENEWDGIADVDPAGARAMRASVAAMLEREGAPAAAAHFHDLAFGRMVRLDGKTMWTVGGA